MVQYVPNVNPTRNYYSLTYLMIHAFAMTMPTHLEAQFLLPL